ncbi:MAG: Fe-S cluster assembly protein HesB [Lactobacillaceae bacterium]|nr:Fe-S cluster assembly protein HesB [Lactobacillaceae bacterium]
MKLVITNAASRWFQKHLQLNTGDGVKFFGTTIQPHHVQHTPNQGFAAESDLAAAVLTVTKDGINYHINLDDEWFFSGLVTTVDTAAGAEQPQFTFQKEHPTPTTPATDSTAPAIDATTGASRRFESYWE